MTQRTNAKKETILHKAVVQWKTNPIFSTACVLVLMIILQTLALGFDFESIGAWFSHWSRNWINILRNNASVGIVALGMTFVIISGGIDLAVGSTLVAVGAVLMVCVNSYPTGLLTSIGITGVPAFIIGIIACILMGCALGGVSGFLIAKQKLPAFIATLGMMKICRSVTQQVMQTASVKVPTQFLAIANTKIGGQVILPIIYWLVLAVLLNRKMIFRSGYRTIFFLPMVAAPAAVAMVWKFMYNQKFGLLNNLLGGPGMNARLNLSLRERNGLVYTVESMMTCYGDTGLWATYFGCDPADVDRCLRLVRRELDKLMAKPLSATQLAAAKRQLKGQIGVACDNRESFALSFGKSFLHYGQERNIPALYAAIDRITPDDLWQVARHLFAPDRLYTLIYK